MAVHALLEPLACHASPVSGFLSSDDPVFAGAGVASDFWSVSLVGWQETVEEVLLSKGLPEGLSMGLCGTEPCVLGTLSRLALDRWIQYLRACVDPVLAEALLQSLTAHLAPEPVLRWGSWCLDLSRPRIMGIINVTPDSFSGDGLRGRVMEAVAQGVRMAAEGADILDIGGESTRPGARPVGREEELERVIPVVEALAREVDLPIAVDTSKPEVMASALSVGASMINDVAALRGCADTGFLTQVLAKQEVPVVLMHMQGTPATMQEKPSYRCLFAEIYAFFAERLRYCLAHGMARQHLILDPGIGFGKSPLHNLNLLRHLRLFRGLGLPILLGVSRKRLVGAMTGESEARCRDPGSHVLGVLAALSGARILRVHDVAGARQALAVAHAWSHGLDPAP